MPVTLRHVQPDAGHKLRQLETSAAELERAARESIPPELLPQPAPRHLRKLADKANAYGKVPLSHIQRAHAAARRWAKPVAGAIRATIGLITETAFYVILALGGLFAVAALILLLAPPA